MSLGKKIESVMGDIAPTTAYVNESDEHCMVYQYTVGGIQYGDDEPQEAVADIELHLFAPLDTDISTDIVQIQKRLVNEIDTTVPEISNEATLNFQHYVFQCQTCVSCEELMRVENQ